MNDGQLVAQMSVLLGGIATLERLREVGINVGNLEQLLEGYEHARTIINRTAEARGIASGTGHLGE